MDSKSIIYEGAIKGFPLIKIKSKEIIEKIRKGSFFMSSLKTYRELYRQSGDDTIGDPNEGKLVIHEAFLTIPETGERTLIMDQALPTVNENDFVFCMFGINPNLHNEFLFTEEQKQKLIRFDNTAMLVTDAYEFSRRIVQAANQRGLTIKSGFVKYYDERINNGNIYIDLLTGGTENIVFHKTKKYEYQQEFRFTIRNTTGESSLTLDIGDISDITEVFTTEQLFSSIIKKSE